MKRYSKEFWLTWAIGAALYMGSILLALTVDWRIAVALFLLAWSVNVDRLVRDAKP